MPARAAASTRKGSAAQQLHEQQTNKAPREPTAFERRLHEVRWFCQKAKSCTPPSACIHEAPALLSREC